MEGSPWKLGTRGGDRSLEADSAEIAGCCSRTAEYAWTANATNPHHALPCHLPCPSYSTYCQDQPKPNLSRRRKMYNSFVYILPNAFPALTPGATLLHLQPVLIRPALRGGHNSL